MFAARGPDEAELIAALPVALLVVDPDGRVVRANGECEALLNRSERSMRGQPIDTVLPEAGGQRDGQGDGQAVAAFDAEIGTSRGAVRVDMIQAEVPDHPGWRTITLHNAAGRRLAHDRTAAARSAVGAAAMLAHEIKNPLSSIRGAAQLIADGAEQADLTRLMIAEVDRIAALIDHMEGFTDTRPRNVEPLNIYPLLAHAREVALAGFARGIAIEEQYDPSLPRALGNGDALLQVLLNLLTNAAHALGRIGERRITLATAYRHGFTMASRGQPRVALPIEICVMDTGPGAPADIADHLFDPFVSGRPEGKGLGLALTDKLVRDMGGVIRYSREGNPHMTVFRILLPRAPK
ncbi:PAS domain-containing sensor histidine kinase [Sphingomonas sp. Leaf412]|uniref:two-component system sensor histidine kinase NtrB n=1 Tax=Sphingomonas sp. Leaf412 TaxID=1736370 RepID=UPI0006F5156C|nr:ATP-binding protein [Sphingomonas sp. Leaf412]KQT32472.1 PAS domain-containing sensor histidine kinase [Sphingomonas sp. Leaf412]